MKNAEIELSKAKIGLLKKLSLQERQMIKGKSIPINFFKMIETVVKNLIEYNRIKI